MPAGIGHTTFWAIEEEELTPSLLSTCLWHKRGAMGTGRIPEIPFSSPRFKSRGLGGRGGKRVKQSSGFHPGGPRGPRSSQRSQGRGAGGLRTPLCSVPKCPIEWDSSFQHSSYAISSLRARKVTGPGVRKTSLLCTAESFHSSESVFLIYQRWKAPRFAVTIKSAKADKVPRPAPGEWQSLDTGRLR